MSRQNARAALQQYKKVDLHSQVDGASPHRLIQMLMEGALQKLYASRSFMEQGELGPKAENISWAISIIDGMRISLDKDQGGEIAQNLDDLYDYVVRRLIDANLKNDTGIVDEVVELLKQIKEAWDAIAGTERPKTGQPAA